MPQCKRFTTDTVEHLIGTLQAVKTAGLVPHHDRPRYLLIYISMCKIVPKICNFLDPSFLMLNVVRKSTRRYSTFMSCIARFSICITLAFFSNSIYEKTIYPRHYYNNKIEQVFALISLVLLNSEFVTSRVSEFGSWQQHATRKIHFIRPVHYMFPYHSVSRTLWHAFRLN